ncbi:MAG TPA: hypothetical protein VFT22_07440 [Kofleriaceae bacterium]|nr:hypothetical protein [Kofleriaceae bacterium]
MTSRRPDGLTLEVLARHVHELHRCTPPWERLSEPERSRRIVAYWRAVASYEAGRREPREVRIEP